MGMFDEIYCDAPMPDEACEKGACFQTKSFPDPCMCRYRITASGRLVDSDGNDLEPSGYITFYDLPTDRAPDGDSYELVEYRAKFLDGNLENIVRTRSAERCDMRYGLASFRWFQSRSFLFDDGTEDDNLPEGTDHPA
jgi:hypothetical protein